MSKKVKLYTYKSLKKLVQRIRDDLNSQDFVLLYAYNGTGKTRLSMAFKDAGKKDDGRDTLYFNAFTEDLFHWDNDLPGDTERVLIMNDKSRFLKGFKELALEERIFNYLERYTDFDFNINYEKWTISFSREESANIKVSRGEENIFIWCIFLAICELTIDGAEAYDWVRYIYIDDPISSLDDNNAIAVASDLAKLLKDSKNHLKTVISTHHGLFFNVMCNELKKKSHKQYFLYKGKSPESYVIRATDDTPFFHHVAMLCELQKAAESGSLYTNHFNMLRCILEKTATFFGFSHFSACVEGMDDEVLYTRALDLLSHGNYSAYEPREMVPDTKDLFRKILSSFLERYRCDLPELSTKETKEANLP